MSNDFESYIDLKFENYIDLKKEKPPFDVLVKVKGSDFMGDFYLDKLFMRKLYRNPNKPINKWRWVSENGDKCPFDKDIDGWKWP